MATANSRRKTAFAALLAICVQSTAAPYNPFDDFDLNSNSPVICKSISTKEERAFYEANSRLGLNGVPEREIPSAFMQQIVKLRALSRGSHVSGRFKDVIDPLKFEAELVESRNRSTLFFQTPRGTAMLTLWDIQADGGQVVVIKDFLNAKVGDTPAAVSIGYSTGSPDLIWAVSFVRSGLNYEFKIPDSRIQSEAAHLTKSQVLTIAANVLVTSGRRVGDPYC